MAELTLAAIRAQLVAGDLSVRDLAAEYLHRIATLDQAGPRLNAVIEVNPDVWDEADRLDAELRAGRPRGPLHGAPILLKDNIATRDRMLTTAGSLALLGAAPPEDAPLVARLRAAGALLLGKTNLSEWANFRSTRSTSGWSSRGGQTHNPYALDRNPCGSSSGSAVAVAADLCAAAVGTETDGSIICPSHICGIVGVKPTVGLVSRAGVIPIAHSQDTAGPMARTVADAAALLAVLAGPDPRDPATAAIPPDYPASFAPFLVDDLAGLRIGVARNLCGFHPGVDALLEDAIRVLRDLGAEIVDPTDVPIHKELGDSEMTVLLYEFKAGLNAYLAGLGPDAPVRSLADVIAFNEAHRDTVMPFFGQELLLQAQTKGPLTDAAYLEALATNRRLGRDEGIDAVLAEYRLDALIEPSGGPAWLTDHINGDHYTGGKSAPTAVAGYPSVTVPLGYIGAGAAAPAGLPVGVSFVGAAWSEPRLIRCAYAFEQATRVRRPPAFLPTLAPYA
ncbi:MAG: Glutamyl-tRNA(Gln) amidotransferase subunit A [Chloroflexi bacterium ADurb.Bin325]|nr:MAG: Glutamyl-tRNA(Gln) amidotransferase subunit A [Chloroflexi bacterium ADurb.Bin325]